MRRVEDPVQRERELDDAEVRAEVAGGDGDGLHDELANLRRQRGELVGAEPAQVGGAFDGLEDHVRRERYPLAPTVRSAPVSKP